MLTFRLGSGAATTPLPQTEKMRIALLSQRYVWQSLRALWSFLQGAQHLHHAIGLALAHAHAGRLAERPKWLTEYAIYGSR